MLVIIIAAIAWPILTRAAQLSVAAITIGYGVVLAIRVRRVERTILSFASTSDRTLVTFDCKPTRGQRRAIRASLRLALHQTELTSLFPGFARYARQLVLPQV